MLRHFLWLTLFFCGTALAEESRAIKKYGFKVLNTYPHDRWAFTQGLLFHDGLIYESTGLKGRSTLREVELKTGRVLRQINLAAEHFAEGVTLLDENLYQLTWTSGEGLIFDLLSFEYRGPIAYRYSARQKRPWGLTDDGKHLILSDGSANIYFIDPETHEELSRILVRSDNGKVSNLNELEYINGEIFANVWRSDVIVRIDPASGAVKGEIDLTELYRGMNAIDDVLNGIAYDEARDRLFVTGKRWPHLYEIELYEIENSEAVP